MSEMNRNIGLVLLIIAIFAVLNSFTKDEPETVEAERYIPKHLDCVQYDPLKDAETLDKALSNIQMVSGDDYKLMCDYVDYIEVSDSEEKPYALIFNTTDESTIVIPKRLLEDFGETNINWVSSVIMHETCHHLQHKLYRGYNGFSISDIERPCVKIQDYFLYQAGGKKDFEGMVKKIQTNKYGFSVSKGSDRMENISLTGNIQNYCNDVQIEMIKNGEDVEIRNRGFEVIHCAFIDLRVDGYEVPMECSFIEGRTIRNVKLKKPYSKSLNITAAYLGCGEKLYLRIEG